MANPDKYREYQKWDYKVVMGVDWNPLEAEIQLIVLGHEGWKLVTSCSRGSYPPILYFIRPVLESE